MIAKKNTLIISDLQKSSLQGSLQTLQTSRVFLQGIAMHFRLRKDTIAMGLQHVRKQKKSHFIRLYSLFVCSFVCKNANFNNNYCNGFANLLQQKQCNHLQIQVE